jgi:hypothetical protein
MKEYGSHLSFVICNDSHKNKNGGQQLKYNKMKFRKMESQTEIYILIYYKNRTHLCTCETWVNLMSINLKLKTPKN